METSSSYLPSYSLVGYESLPSFYKTDMGFYNNPKISDISTAIIVELVVRLHFDNIQSENFLISEEEVIGTFIDDFKRNVSPGHNANNQPIDHREVVDYIRCEILSEMENGTATWEIPIYIMEDNLPLKERKVFQQFALETNFEGKLRKRRLTIIKGPTISEENILFRHIFEDKKQSCETF